MKRCLFASVDKIGARMPHIKADIYYGIYRTSGVENHQQCSIKWSITLFSPLLLTSFIRSDEVRLCTVSALNAS